MKHKAILWLCVALLLAATAPLRAAAEESGPRSPEQMTQAVVKKAEERLEALNKSEDLAHFGETLGLVLQIWNGDSQSLRGKRLRKVSFELTLRLLDVLDRRIDDAFDPEAPPGLHVDPPAETGLFAGVDPKEIDDPKLREEYETALRLNDEKIERHSRQIQLRTERQRMLLIVDTFIKYGYGTSPEEAQEIERALETRLSKESTRDEIRAMIAAEKDEKEEKEQAADETQQEEPEESEDPTDDSD